MHGTLLILAVLLAATGLSGQEFPTPKPLPPLPVATPDTADGIAVSGVGGKTVRVFTKADLLKLPRHSVKTEDRGIPVTFGGVLLSDVLAAVDTPTGDKFHSTAASYYVVVQAKDGYKAVFAWAELDSTFQDKAVYLVMTRDGRSIPEAQGPIQLVVPGEKRNARWVRQVTAVGIRQAN